MERVRLSADVEPELRRRVRIAAAKADRKVSDWIADAVRRELEREEEQEYYPSEGPKPRGSRNPVRPKGGGNPVSEAVIEDRR